MNDFKTQIGFRAVFRGILLTVLLAGSGLLMMRSGDLSAEPAQAVALVDSKPCKPPGSTGEIDKKCRTATPTSIPVNSATARPSPTATHPVLPTRTATSTSTSTRTPASTATATLAATATSTVLPTQPATLTATPVTEPTNMPPATATPIPPAPSSTATATRLPDQVGTAVPTATPTATSTATPTQAPTEANPSAPEATAEGPSVFHVYLPVLMESYSCSQLLPDCYEPNNTMTTAADIVVPGTTVATIDKAQDRYDFYRLALQGGTTYAFTLTFDQADLDLYLYLYAEGATPQLLASSNFTSVGMAEHIRFTSAVSGPYYLLVYGFDSAAPVTYQLTLETP